MNVWMNKMSGDLCVAHPQWEPITITFDEHFYKDLGDDVKEMVGDRKVASGTLVQVGWLIQNQNDVWLGFPLSIKDQFEEIGEL